VNLNSPPGVTSVSAQLAYSLSHSPPPVHKAWWHCQARCARLADIVSGDWLRYRFPGDAPSVRSGIDRRHARSHYHDSTDEPHSNYQFIRYRAPKTLSALLRDLDAVLRFGAHVISLRSWSARRSATTYLPAQRPCESLRNLGANWQKGCRNPQVRFCGVLSLHCRGHGVAHWWIRRRKSPRASSALRSPQSKKRAFSLASASSDLRSARPASLIR
jgi:hypothetical protein